MFRKAVVVTAAGLATLLPPPSFALNSRSIFLLGNSCSRAMLQIASVGAQHANIMNILYRDSRLAKKTSHESHF
jgi:hypothetical protein